MFSTFFTMLYCFIYFALRFSDAVHSTAMLLVNEGCGVAYVASTLALWSKGNVLQVKAYMTGSAGPREAGAFVRKYCSQQIFYRLVTCSTR